MIDTGQWIFGDLLQNGSITHISNFDNGVNREHYEVNQYTVGQFTGLIDKNGKEIYEGDYWRVGIGASKIGNEFTLLHSGGIVSITPHGIYIGKTPIWANGHIFSNGKGEVIGNIHENPELGEGK